MQIFILSFLLKASPTRPVEGFAAAQKLIAHPDLPGGKAILTQTPLSKIMLLN
jgi:hypothetical protein